MRILTLALVSTALLSPALYAQSYKCQGADGRIEYSDRPCEGGKNVLSQPKGQAATSKPTVSGMERLKVLFTDYEERLCAREKLATEMDMAHRANAINKDAAQWKPKQERLSLLNDTLIEFQDKAAKITQAAGADSEESRALRKFQSKLKDCGKPAEKTAGK